MQANVRDLHLVSSHALASQVPSAVGSTVFFNNAAPNSSSYSLNNQLSNYSGHYSTPLHRVCVCARVRTHV